jgi:hypothetical protein
VIRPLSAPLKPAAGLTVLSGNLFDAAVMKTSVIGETFARYLANPDDPEAFEGKVVVFDGPEDYHHRIDDPALGITERSILVIRGAGPIGYPGGAEVVNMRPPAALIRAGVDALPCIGDGRQSGTGALDPQRFAGSGGGRRSGAAAHGRYAHRSEKPQRQCAGERRGTGRRRAETPKIPSPAPKARRRGRKSPGARPANSQAAR